MARYTADQILQKLDNDASALRFPMLDNGYIYPGDVRLMAYRNEDCWAILIEMLGYHYRSGFPRGIYSNLYTAGNGVVEERVCQTCAQVFEAQVDSLDEDEDGEGDVPDDLKEVFIRGVAIEVPRERSIYQTKGIKLKSEATGRDALFGEKLLRVLLPEHREALLATNEELARFLKPNVPFFLRLDAWHHPDVSHHELPSQTGTFPALAEAIASGDPNRFRTTTEPNTHWKNWPAGGTL